MSAGRSATARRAELADFLRSRRDQLTPERAGLPAGGQRRTPGLRREEVAELSGVSLTWYTWLEQARDINVSEQVLTALARALQLDEAETDHLFTLGGVAPIGTTEPVASPPATLTRLLRAVEPNPAYAISPRWDIVAWNASYEALYLGVSQLPDEDRNLLWLVFTSPAVRELLGDDWAGEARRLLSQFRAEVVHRSDEPAFRDLVERLREASGPFRDWWSRHDVAYFESRQRIFEHPRDGTLRFDHHKLIPADHPELRIIVYTPADVPDEPSPQGNATEHDG